jgi:hypothetical protein
MPNDCHQFLVWEAVKFAVRLSLSSLLNQTLSAVTLRPLHQRRQAEVANYRRMLDRQANGELSLASR